MSASACNGEDRSSRYSIRMQCSPAAAAAARLVRKPLVFEGAACGLEG